MTESTQDSLEFESHFSRQVVARFDGGALTSDAGALLLRETDRRIRLIERLAACFDDHRDPSLVRHPVQEMVAQRVYGLALGYEDLNDHDELWQDPLLALFGRQARAGQGAAGGQEHAESD